MRNRAEFQLVAAGAFVAVVLIGLSGEIGTYGLRATIYTWQGLLAGILGLAAGSIVWFATQRQIHAAAELEKRRETDAHELFVEIMRDVLGMIEIGWTKVDQIIAANPNEDIGRRYGVYFTLDEHTETLRKEIERSRVMIADMGLLSRSRAETLIRYIEFYFRSYQQARKDFPPADAEVSPSKDAARGQRIPLSHLREAARRFDVRLSEIFAERAGPTVNWQPTPVLFAALKQPDWPDHSAPAPSVETAVSGASRPQTSQPGRARRALSSILGRFGK